MLRCTPPSPKIAISNPCRLAHAKFIRVVPSDGPRADAFPATMLTSENGIREFHSGPKYGRIEIGDHKLTKIDRGATSRRRTVAKTGNLSLAEGARLVVDRGLDDLEILFGGTGDHRAGCLQPDDAMTFVDATDLRVC